MTLKKSSLSKCAYWSNFRSINFFSSKKFATNQHEEKKKAKGNQSVCNIFGGEYNCISLSFQKKKCFLRWNEEWSQRKDEWQEHLEKPHCCKEKDNIFVQSFYLCFWCFCVQFNLAKLFGLKSITIIFVKHQIWCWYQCTWKGVEFHLEKCNKNFIFTIKIWFEGSNALLEFFFEISHNYEIMHRVKSSYIKTWTNLGDCALAPLVLHPKFDKNEYYIEWVQITLQFFDYNSSVWIKSIHFTVTWEKKFIF